MNEQYQKTRSEMNTFFISVQTKALRHAEFSVKNREDALDLVQEAMEKLAKKYAHKPEDWGPLFHRILQNAIKDWYRKQKVKRLFSLSYEENLESTQEEPVGLENLKLEEPQLELTRSRDFKMARAAIAQLPERQKQAFLLRAWWGHDVAETALAMSCSQGSVKTHYSRAVNKLKVLLTDLDGKTI
jgi:RNA polymerase sigma-70 factor (ECF subfamily)